MGATTAAKPTPPWTWVLLFLLGWGAVGQGATLIFLALVLLVSEYASVAVTILLCVAAWFGTRFAIERGAPRGIWGTTLIGTIPLFVMFASLMLPDFPDKQLRAVPFEYWTQMRSFLGSSALIALVGLAPPLTSWLASRRFSRGMEPSPLVDETVQAPEPGVPDGVL